MSDLVLELTFLGQCPGGGLFFAKGAVDILERLGIDHLMFGTEKCWITESILGRLWSKGRADDLGSVCLDSYPIPRLKPCGRSLQGSLSGDSKSYLGLGLM